MIKSFYATRQWAPWSYGGGLLLIVSLWLQVQMTVAINTWYGGFYDLLQNAADYQDKPAEGIDLFFSKLVSPDYVVSGFEGEPSFSRVHGGFALFLHNWTTITELRSIWKRLHEFENNLDRYAIPDPA